VNVWPFFLSATFTSSPAALRRPDNEAIRPLILARLVTERGLAPASVADTDWRRPSPPPCGWSRGFMAEPRTVWTPPIRRARSGLSDAAVSHDPHCPPGQSLPCTRYGYEAAHPMANAPAHNRLLCHHWAPTPRHDQADHRVSCQLDVVNRCPVGIFFNGNALPAEYQLPVQASTLSANLQPQGRDNIALLASDNAAAQYGPSDSDRINSGHLSGYAQLVALEINQSISALGPTTTVARSNLA